jgi:hypothetical protein
MEVHRYGEKNGVTKCASTQCRRASMNDSSQLWELLSHFACVQQANDVHA